ncbi:MULTISPECIES: hypothetical protein [unclassified Adlercreutzia]|uniref:hypothetical protein n=1 Tax=unclassified Adlercreutzia TaxID=2636013 RepID=UPI0013EA7913|nr:MULTISPECIES: hypothetical protein [unclassified Adlercreutzia]
MLVDALLVVLIVAMALVACVFVANVRYLGTNHWKLKVLQLEKYIEEVPRELTVANLGSAHAREAFDYQAARVKGFNFALKSQTLSYDLAILRRYSDRFATGAIVIVAIAPLLFAVVHYPGQNNRMYYHFLPREDIREYSPLIALQERMLPVLSSKRALLSVVRDASVTTPVRQCTSEEEREEEALCMEQAWCRNFGLENLKDAAPAERMASEFEVNRKYLREIVEQIRVIGAKPALVIPPMTDVMLNRFSDAFLKAFMYDNIVKSGVDAPVLDYLRDERFIRRHEFFLDSELLNGSGSSEFTRIVLNDLESAVITSQVQLVNRESHLGSAEKDGFGSSQKVGRKP